ncbi:MAG TPA: uracil-DNA glycosylase [Candidatus Paceibacterota bacterium]|nr:uracil-DNA glycosylase [Candidatus Paceibacterota bacterium]
MGKKEVLKKLAAEMAADKSLPLSTNLVFGEGNPDCEVLFIGEAPGANEDMQKRPFVGRGGQLLNDCLRGIGWKREQVYITNIVKRRPPENRDPLPEEIAAYKPYLKRQIQIINPKIIVPLGRFAMNYFLPEAKITRDQGHAFKLSTRLIVPMLHPAAALRSNGMMGLFRESFKKMPRIVSGEFLAEAVASVPVSAMPATKKESAKPKKKMPPKLF